MSENNEINEQRARKYLEEIAKEKNRASETDIINNAAKNDTADEKPEYMVALERKIRREKIILNNPVIMQGLGLSPLLIACSTATNALILSVAALFLLTPTRMLASLLCKRAPVRFRGAVYALCSGIVFIGVYALISSLFESAQIIQLGLYLPLLTIDPIILKRYERVQNEKVYTAFKKGIITTLGYVLVLMSTGIMREFLGLGSVFGNEIIDIALLPLAALPTGGFIILALVMALWRSVAEIIKRYMHDARVINNE